MDYFSIKIVDDETSRGVPLVELRTPNHLRFFTDSNGIAAIGEPGLMNQEVFLNIKSHGYRFEKMFFDKPGVVLKVVPGGSATLTIKRINIAERLYRITGEGIYRDSILVGHPVPLKNPVLNGGVAGQDTVIACVYNGKIYWCWGDTIGLSRFNGSASGATSKLPGRGGLDPAVGVDLNYFIDESGFSKAMCPFDVPGLKWIEGLTTVKDETGRERLVTRYASHRDLGYAHEWGLALFNDDKQEFERVKGWDIHRGHRSAHPFHAEVDGKDMIYIFPNLRVPANLDAMKDLAQYEAFTCLVPGARFEGQKLPPLERDSDGSLVYAWKADTDPVDDGAQRRLINSGAMKPGEAWYGLYDMVSGEYVGAGYASVAWNKYRRRWILISAGHPGEIWYAEGDTPMGPWVYSRKVVSHNNYNFYNPVHHPFFDQEDGKIIYFEGTYTDFFSGTPEKTPEYEYNQVMYRLTLSDPRLFLPLPVYRMENENGTDSYLMREAVDSGDLWDHVKEIPFFALPPDRPLKDSIPVFIKDTKSGTILETGDSLEKSGKKICFLAFPSEIPDLVEADRISGIWNCRAVMPVGGEINFSLDLKNEGNKVSGFVQFFDKQPVEGTFEDKDLLLTIRAEEDVYEIRARLERDSLKGEWKKRNSWEKGIFEGDLSPDDSSGKSSSALVPLYVYKNAKTGSVRYSTNPEWKNEDFERDAKPLCRVWKNPMSLLIIDPKAKPM